MTDIDPAAVKAAHIGDGLEPVECEGCRAACLYCEGDHPWPCEPYRLADALAAALDELDRLATHTAEAFAQRDAAQAKVARIEALARVSGGTSGRPPASVRAADIRAALADG